jgi:FKBP-type peptidyl-prolyl cis-trans isomerase
MDDNTSDIDEEWKAYNEQQVADVSKNTDYQPRKSQSDNGSIYFKYIDFFAETATKSTKITDDGTPYFTDSVAIRYEGSFLLKDGTKYTFDTTEGDNNGRILRSRVSGFVDGFATMLQHMHKGDQVEVVIPYLLGYGTYGNYSGSVQTIPGYTTLRFKIYLLDIIPDNPDEFKK